METPVSENDEAVIEVRDDRDASRFVVEVDGEVAGLADYRIKGNRQLFVHTEISDEFGGRGLGSRLARFALDDAIANGYTIVPICPFIAGWIAKHPEYEGSTDTTMLKKVLEKSADA